MEKWIKGILIGVTIFDIVYMLASVFCAICNVIGGNTIGAINCILAIMMGMAFLSILWDCK